MTHSSIINISSDRIIQWMDIIRETSGPEQYRLLENFWASQIRSKAWLINTLKSLRLLDEGDVYIFGGWYGILGSLIKDSFLYKNVYSIDIDSTCEHIGKKLDNRITFITSDMANFSFDNNTNIGLIVNTSTEHVSQQIFDTWLQQMPENVPIILQGNNYFECKEHVRCTTNLSEFIEYNKLQNILFSGELNCEQFTRFMEIGRK